MTKCLADECPKNGNKICCIDCERECIDCEREEECFDKCTSYKRGCKHMVIDKEVNEI